MTSVKFETYLLCQENGNKLRKALSHDEYQTLSKEVEQRNQ
jgi:hypothetical protein